MLYEFETQDQLTAHYWEYIHPQYERIKYSLAHHAPPNLRNNYTLACRTPQDLSTFCNERRMVGDWEKIYCGQYVSLENLNIDDNILEVEKYVKEHPLTEKKKSRSLYTIIRRLRWLHCHMRRTVSF